MEGPHSFAVVMETLSGRVDSTYDGVLAIVQGLLLTAACSFGIAMNFLAFFFFQRKKTAFKLKVVLKAATCMDLTVCFLLPCIILSAFANRQAMVFSNGHFCQIWGYLWSFASRFTANIVAITSLLRLINLYHPSVVTVTRINFILIVDAVTLLLIEILPLLLKERYVYITIVGACAPGFAGDNISPITMQSVLISYIPGMMYFLPFPISLTCYIVIFFKLRRQSRRNTKRLGGSKKFQREAMLTLSSFMMVYLLLQAPLALYITFLVIKIGGGSSILAALSSEPWWISLYMPNIVYIAIVSLNAALNPIIYYWRLPEFRTYVSNVCSRSKKSRCLSHRKKRKRKDRGRTTWEIFNAPYYRPLYWENVVDWERAMKQLNFNNDDAVAGQELLPSSEENILEWERAMQLISNNDDDAVANEEFQSQSAGQNIMGSESVDIDGAIADQELQPQSPEENIMEWESAMRLISSNMNVVAHADHEFQYQSSKEAHIYHESTC